MKIDNIKTTILVVLSLVFVVPAILSYGIRYLPERDIPETGGSIKIFGDSKLTFNINSQKDNLVGILIKVKNVKRSDTNLKLQVMDEKNNIVGESSLNGLSILDGSVIRFSFPTLSSHKGQSVWKSVFTSDADEENAMEVYLEKDSSNPSFAPLYKPPSHLALIRNIYIEWFKHFFGINNKG